MASTVAAYPNSNVSPSKKNRLGKTLKPFLWLDVRSLIRSSVMKAVLDFVVFVAILLALFMVPA
jgi:hypothetical protein